MAINSYDDLVNLVEKRRQETLTLDIDLGSNYSPEYEKAKEELEQAKVLQKLTGTQQFMNDNVVELENKVTRLKPEPNIIHVKFRRLGLARWTAIMKKPVGNAIDQFIKVLPETFIGIFTDLDEEAEPLSTDYKLVDPNDSKCVLPGGAIQPLIQSFMNWQNSGGEISFHPTKLGHD